MTKLFCIGAAALVLILAMAGIRPVLAEAAPHVVVEGTELRLIDGGGQVRSGDALVGGELTLVDAYGEHRLRIESSRLDKGDPARAIRLYAFSIWNAASGRWGELCRPGPDGLKLAVPIPGYFTDQGRYVPDPERFTITCTGGAIGKCVRFGYRPWEHAADGAALVDLYRTCVRIVRAEYCGNGHGWTRNGTPIELHDAFGILREEEAPGMSFEAAWGPDGAHCVAHVRVPANGSLEDLLKTCPRLAGRIGKAACPSSIQPGKDGVLIVNKS
jgi:hypothetical protein